MIRTIRAAGFAVAALAFAATAMWSNPLQAGAGDAQTVASSYLDHAGAVGEVSDIGLNGGGMNFATATVAAGEAANDTSNEVGTIEVDATLGLLAERLAGLAESALPQPRTLGELIETYAGGSPADREQDCLANAIYFEARGEPIEGQLAVAEVVLNRARSGRYPATICEVVTQPWQFSFVRRGIIPDADRNCEAWRRAVAIARIAEAGASRLLPNDVLWYHAEYVSPSWGRRLDRNTKIGLHIFYS
jgi:hypothetical protein